MRNTKNDADLLGGNIKGGCCVDAAKYTNVIMHQPVIVRFYKEFLGNSVNFLISK